MCGERATVASAAIVFSAPVAGFPPPSLLPFLSFFSLVFSIRVSLAFPPTANSLSLTLISARPLWLRRRQRTLSEAEQRSLLSALAPCVRGLPHPLRVRLAHSALPFFCVVKWEWEMNIIPDRRTELFGGNFSSQSVRSTTSLCSSIRG